MRFSNTTRKTSPKKASKAGKNRKNRSPSIELSPMDTPNGRSPSASGEKKVKPKELSGRKNEYNKSPTPEKESCLAIAKSENEAVKARSKSPDINTDQSICESDGNAKNDNRRKRSVSNMPRQSPGKEGAKHREASISEATDDIMETIKRERQEKANSAILDHIVKKGISPSSSAIEKVVTGNGDEDVVSAKAHSGVESTREGPEEKSNKPVKPSSQEWDSEASSIEVKITRRRTADAIPWTSKHAISSFACRSLRYTCSLWSRSK